MVSLGIQVVHGRQNVSKLLRASEIWILRCGGQCLIPIPAFHLKCRVFTLWIPLCVQASQKLRISLSHLPKLHCVLCRMAIQVCDVVNFVQRRPVQVNCMLTWHCRWPSVIARVHV